MKLLFLLAFCAALQFEAFTQSSGKTYRCAYSDTVSMSFGDSVVKEMAGSMAVQNSLSDSMAKDLAGELAFQLALQPVYQVQKRKVTATADSTIIEMDPLVQREKLEMPLSFAKMVIEKGRKIKAIYNYAGEALPLPKDEARHFKATGSKRTILGYECKAYVSKDGKATVWVTTALPSYINPGVRNVDVEGAILAFKLVSPSSTIFSIAQQVAAE